jgi:release factor glutamine methyltransferase
MDTGAPREKLRVADVGTGSGCLAVALAWELPHADVYATDISAPALEVAQRNAARHSVANRLHFLQCDLLDALQQSRSPDAGARLAAAGVSSAAAAPCSLSPESLFDVIVSNPPYISLAEATHLQREVRDHEPHQALFGGCTGVEIYRRLIEQTRDLLRNRGLLVLELGHDSAEYVRGIFDEQSGWTNVSITMDLAGIPRVLAAERAR